MAKSILIQMLPADEIALTKLRSASASDVTVFKSSGLDGQSCLNVLVYLSTVTLPLVAKLLVELIRARKHVSVKVDGVELTGLSEKTAKDLLTQLAMKPDDQPG